MELNAYAASKLDAQAVVQPTDQGAGSFRLFRIVGTDVLLHWSWVLVAVFSFQSFPAGYSSWVWSIGEYLSGFAIILLHELGHVLACRQVGGIANRVVLWPLGGLAYVSHPARPASSLWVAVAGPLTNLLLLPLFVLAVVLAARVGLDLRSSDLGRLIIRLSVFNLIVLVFNLVPIYPLDGGRILHALLWFFGGRSWGLMVASVVGLFGSFALFFWAALVAEWQLALFAIFLVIGAAQGIRHAILIASVAKAARLPNCHCPACGTQVPVGEFWICTRCSKWFDLYGTLEACRAGDSHFCHNHCFDCGRDLSLVDLTSPTPGDSPSLENSQS